MSKPIEDAADIISEQNALIEELQAKLAAQAAPVVAASELTDEQIYKFWLYRDCMDAIQAGDMKAQFISAARAMLAAAAPAASVAVPAEKPSAPEGWDDAIRLIVKGYNYGAGYYNDEDFCNGLERLFILAGVYLDEEANEYRMPPATPAAQAQQTAGDGWISVAERMPTEWEMVLTWGSKKVDQAVMAWNPRDGWQIETASEWHTAYPPTHWRALPPAPGLMEAE